MNRARRPSVRRVSEFLSDPVRKFQLSILALLSLIASGTAGYIMIEGMGFVDALYMTIITITTVGFNEVQPLSPGGRIFTMVVILVGVAIVAWAIRNGAEMVLGETLWLTVQRRKMNKIIDNLNGHYIICGYGRMGRQITRDMKARGEEFVIVDLSTTLEEQMLEDRVPYIIGDATHDSVLEQAGIHRARGLVAALNSDADNVLAVLTARGVNPRLQIVARAVNELSESKLRRAGADRVVSPYAIGGHRLALAMLQPAVHDFFNKIFNLENLDVDIGEIRVEPTSRFAGQTIAECDLRRVWNLIILGIRKTDGDFAISPDARRVIEAGETLIVIGSPTDIYKLETDSVER